MFLLCVVGTAALAGESELALVIELHPVDVPRNHPPCAPVSAEADRLIAIYLDLDPAPRAEAGLPSRMPMRQWLCASSASSEIASPSLSPAALSIDLLALDASTLALTLESEAGDIWEIDFARLDGLPLEPAAFASDGAGFFINRVEWSDAGEIISLDMDFEVDRAEGDSLWGRLLWHAPWTPDEPAFTPLSLEEWAQASPGEIVIVGPDFAALFSDTSTTVPAVAPSVLSVGVAGTGPVPVDDILYSPDPVKGPEEAVDEVAPDVANLFEIQAAHRESIAKASRAGGVIFMAAAGDSGAHSQTAGSMTDRQAAGAGLMPPRSSASKAFLRLDSTWELECGRGEGIRSAHADPLAGAPGACERVPLDDPARPIPGEDRNHVPGASAPDTLVCFPRDGGEPRDLGNSQTSSAECVTHTGPGEVALSPEIGDRSEVSSGGGARDEVEVSAKDVAFEHSVRRAPAGDHARLASAFGVDGRGLSSGVPAGAPPREKAAREWVSPKHWIEAWSLTLRNVATRWWQVMNSYWVVPQR